MLNTRQLGIKNIVNELLHSSANQNCALFRRQEYILGDSPSIPLNQLVQVITSAILTLHPPFAISSAMDYRYLIDNGEKDIYPGAVYKIQGSHANSLIKENLSRVIQGSHGAVGKEVFYLRGEWKSVSESSYQMSGELEILRGMSSSFASEILEGSVIIELGPSTFIKTTELLNAIDLQAKRILYFAVDIDKASLWKHIPVLNRRYKHIDCFGLHGTFNQALDRFTQGFHQKAYVWSFGSSLSNAQEDEVVLNLKGWAGIACSLLIGQDGTIDEKEIELPYHTEAFNSFFQNGLETADYIIGERIFASDKWKRGCTIRRMPTRHTFIMTAAEDINHHIKEGAQIELFSSFKYTEDGMGKLASQAECTVAKAYAASCAGSRIFHILPNKDSKVEQGGLGIGY